MVVKDVIMAIKMALENVDKRYCPLTQIDYPAIGLDSLKKSLAKKKYLERPFVYEFYYQFRKLIESGEVDFGGPTVQAVLDGGYHYRFEEGKIPDFILDVPSANRKLVVMELRLASNPSRIESDLEKLSEFRGKFGYHYAVETIIGNKTSLQEVKEYLKQFIKPEGEKIMIAEFYIDSWKVVAGMIGYAG